MNNNQKKFLTEFIELMTKYSIEEMRVKSGSIHFISNEQDLTVGDYDFENGIEYKGNFKGEKQ